MSMLSALPHQFKHLICLRRGTLDNEQRRLTISFMMLNILKMYKCLMVHGGGCFTYGFWFALGGLAAAGKSYSNCATVRRGVEFLLRTQMSDSGWGESYCSFPDKVYRELETGDSNLVQTTWH